MSPNAFCVRSNVYIRSDTIMLMLTETLIVKGVRIKERNNPLPIHSVGEARLSKEVQSNYCTGD